MRVVTLILRLTPYGVLAIMTKTIATSDLDSIAKLGKFVIASYVALIVRCKREYKDRKRLFQVCDRI